MSFFLNSSKTYAFLCVNRIFICHQRWGSSTRTINKLLIANRGEIACRVIRTARRLGIKSVAIYSEADKNSLHVEMADEAYCIGPPAVSESYLRGDKILHFANVSRSDAIHPGYGFLSENVEFAENCKNHDVIFIGPPASAIRDMGIKSTSKNIMMKAGVPVIRGYHGEDQSLKKLLDEAKNIGFPIMIKAVRGGGGKGMRISHGESDFEASLQSAKTESEKAFGDSVVLLEKFVSEPRHVEVQIFADQCGNVVHLFERDCSVQRRHQKIIEEAPAPGLPTNLRKELGYAAVRAAKAVGYIGAGTVEFILDKQDYTFHFMEMNTRLQVEHPITEMITGIDLVEWQIKIAAGERLPKMQENITLNGHAFEARIYAENPEEDFLPCAGPLLYMRTPSTTKDVRVETGVREGDNVSVYYDPMIAKLVVWGETRHETLSKLHDKLLQFHVAGLQTNINFLIDLINNPEFVIGNVHTNFIKDNFNSLFRRQLVGDNYFIEAALAAVLVDVKQNTSHNKLDPFIVQSNFRVNHYQERKIELACGELEKCIYIRFIDTDSFQISSENDTVWSSATATLDTSGDTCLMKFTINGMKKKSIIFNYDQRIIIFNKDGKRQFFIKKQQVMHLPSADVGLNKAIAPMPGILNKVLVKPGDSVKKGDPLFILIAMKMEHVVKATNNINILTVCFESGDYVNKDDTVVTFHNK